MRLLLLGCALMTLSITFAQNEFSTPTTIANGGAPEFGVLQNRAVGDSCGAYWNNYLAIGKTSNVFVDQMIKGSGVQYADYGGRAQRFYANQPTEISGIQFFAYETDVTADSIPVITQLHEYVAGNDSIGVLLAQDTGYVTAQSFNILLPSVEVNTVFDAPVTVTDDYVISIWVDHDDTVNVYKSDFNGDGNGEGNSFLIFNNPDAGFNGYYNIYGFTPPGNDGDYLINPRVKYELHQGFTLSNSIVCPDDIGAACVTYNQMPVYGNHHYNADTTDNILWLWGDGFQNTNLLNACHTYTASGSYTIELKDTLTRYDPFLPNCVAETSLPITVLSDPVADFTFIQTASTVDFTSTSTSTDSIWWDFGDTTAGNDSITTTHVYDTLGTYTVWLYAYNACGIDSVSYTVTTDDVGIEDYNFEFNLYPNPANENVTINGLTNGATVDLINVLSQVVSRDVAISDNMQISTGNLSPGTYFIRVSTEYGQVTKKLLIRH